MKTSKKKLNIKFDDLKIDDYGFHTLPDGRHIEYKMYMTLSQYVRLIIQKRNKKDLKL